MDFLTGLGAVSVSVPTTTAGVRLPFASGPHLFDGAWLQYKSRPLPPLRSPEGQAPSAAVRDVALPDRRSQYATKSAAHLLIGHDAAATVRTVSNMPLHVRGFVLRKLAIHPRNQSS